MLTNMNHMFHDVSCEKMKHHAVRKHALNKSNVLKSLVGFTGFFKARLE